MLKFTKFGFADPTAYLDQIEKLQRLTVDLRSIYEGKLPSPAELKSAPVINNWQVTVDLHLSLFGEVTGHPLMLGHRRIMTSPIIVDARELGWFRTASRYYVLGRKGRDNVTFDEGGSGLRVV